MLVYQRVKWFKSRSSMAGATAPFEPRRSIQCRYFQRIFLGKSAAFSRKMIQHQGSNRQTDTPLVIQKTIENGPCIEIVDLHWFTELKNGGSFHIVFWCFLCVYQRVTFFCQKKNARWLPPDLPRGSNLMYWYCQVEVLYLERHLLKGRSCGNRISIPCFCTLW